MRPERSVLNPIKTKSKFVRVSVYVLNVSVLDEVVVLDINIGGKGGGGKTSDQGSQWSQKVK